MGTLDDYKLIKIVEVCTYERAKKGKVYKKGSFCVQVSATRGQTVYIEKDQEIDAKYLVFTLKDGIYNSKYIYIMFTMFLKEFLMRVQTGINIVPEVFEEYEIFIHQDINIQNKIEEIISGIDERIQEEEKEIQNCKDLKKYHLETMFV